MDKVNVRAVMEREAMDRMAAGFPRQADQLHEALAALTELMDAAQDACEADQGCEDWRRLSAALAGVRGV